MTESVSRGGFLAASAATSAAAALTPQAAARRPGSLRMRWYGGGVYELAAPDDRAIVLVDAWIWNNTGFAALEYRNRPNSQAPPRMQRISKHGHPGRSSSRSPTTMAIIWAITSSY